MAATPLLCVPLPRAAKATSIPTRPAGASCHVASGAATTANVPSRNSGAVKTCKAKLRPIAVHRWVDRPLPGEKPELVSTVLFYR